MTKKINEIIEQDSLNQRRLMNGQINRETYEKEKERIHDEYLKNCGETDIIKKLLKKHGGN